MINLSYLTDFCNQDEETTVATHHGKILTATCVSVNKMDKREMSASEEIISMTLPSSWNKNLSLSVAKTNTFSGSS